MHAAQPSLLQPLLGCVVFLLYRQILNPFKALRIYSPTFFLFALRAGRILNRFSRDVETMDSVLNQSLIQFSNCFAAYLAILVVISISTKWFGIAIIPLTVIYVIIQVRAFLLCIGQFMCYMYLS
jgi:ABC-type transport system involved in cytochrome bd biosynthesis fused ATPase/permease subunit